MSAFVVKGKTLPHPPVQRITALARMVWNFPDASSMATTPRTWPSSTNNLVTNHSSYRVMALYLSEVWKRVEHVEAGLVGGEPGSLLLHSAEGSNGDVSVGVPAPGAAPMLEPQHLLGSLPDEGLHGVL